jgi:DNA-binding CsgD family transcriptional regulator
MRRLASRAAERATDREVGVVAAVLVAGSEKAADRLGLSHSTVKHHLANARSRVGAATTAQLVWDPVPAVAGARRPTIRSWAAPEYRSCKGGDCEPR